MKPTLHSLISAKMFGGLPEDYHAIHDFIDSTKAHHADLRHRALLHSSFGIYIVEKVFGREMRNSDGLMVQVRDVAERHVLDDMGRIPSVSDYLNNMTLQKWMGGPIRKHRTTYKIKEIV